MPSYKKVCDISSPDFYSSGEYEADQTVYDNVRVFIRPRRFKESLRSSSSDRGKNIEVAETAEPRMLIIIKTRDSRLGEISLRVDKGDIQNNLKIIYDVVVGLGDKNIIDTLDFGAETGQVVGHHFSSGIVTGDFGCTIERLYEAFNAKLAAYIPASDSGQDPQ